MPEYRAPEGYLNEPIKFGKGKFNVPIAVLRLISLPGNFISPNLPVAKMRLLRLTAHFGRAPCFFFSLFLSLSLCGYVSRARGVIRP